MRKEGEFVLGIGEENGLSCRALAAAICAFHCVIGFGCYLFARCDRAEAVDGRVLTR